MPSSQHEPPIFPTQHLHKATTASNHHAKSTTRAVFRLAITLPRHYRDSITTMPPHDELPRHNPTSDDEALASDTESIPELAPAQEDDAPATNDNFPEEDNDNHSDENNGILSDDHNDSHPEENNGNPSDGALAGAAAEATGIDEPLSQFIGANNATNPAMFAAFLANMVQQLQETGDLPPTNSPEDPHP